MHAFFRILVSVLAIALVVNPSTADFPAAASEHLAAPGDVAMSLVKGCTIIAGDSAKLRTWLENEHLHLDESPAFRPFLMGYAGHVYTIRTSLGGIAVTSLDNGGCSVFFSHVDQGAFVARFSTWILSSFVVERSDDKTVDNGAGTMTHFYEYDLHRGEYHRRVVLSTAPPGGIAEIILTAYGT